MSKFCIYCLKEGGDFTKDHVPPKSLFKKGTSHQTIYSCFSCNNGYSEIDEYCRGVFNLGRTDENYGEVYEKAIRGIHYNNKLRKELIESQAKRFVKFASGYRLSDTFLIDEDKINAFTKRLIIGFFYKKYKESLPINTIFQIEYLGNGPSLEYNKDIDDIVNSLPAFNSGLSGKDFKCFGGRIESKPSISIWLFIFYDSIFLFGTSNYSN